MGNESQHLGGKQKSKTEEFCRLELQKRLLKKNYSFIITTKTNQIISFLTTQFRRRMISKISWRSLLPGCCKSPESLALSSSSDRKKTPLLRRISFSDLSNSTWSAEDLSLSLVGSNLHVFTLAELREITKDFSSSNFLGEGGFGPVHKGFVDEKVRPGLKAQPVAVKVLDLEGPQGHREWLTEVIFLGQLRHAHLVKLIGYCCEDEHHLLVYEYMSCGSLENHLFKRFSASLPWSVRLKIAVGAAKGLAFLHEAEKPVIYRDFKASNILLDSKYNAKLSDFGLAKDGPEGDDTHVSTRIMGTHGYAAPEYVMTGHLTAMSDVYSFGVVLLELLTGRRSMDKNRPTIEQSLVEWARPSLNDARKLDKIMDPRLEGQYSPKAAQKAAALAYQCLSHHAKSRPTMSTVIKTLEPLMDMVDDMPIGPFVYTVAAENGKEDDTKKAAGEETDCPNHNGKEDHMKKNTAKENSHRNHHLHRHGYRRRRRSPSSVAAISSYSDTALYRKYGRNLKKKQQQVPTQGIL